MWYLLNSIIDLICGIFKADQTLAEESRFGDSPEQCASRRSGLFGCLIFLFIVVAIGASLKWWRW
jgi:hypothetical protein